MQMRYFQHVLSHAVDPSIDSHFSTRRAETGLARKGHEVFVLTVGANVASIARDGIAAEQQVRIRRLNFRRDSLEDIFLKAMEV